MARRREMTDEFSFAAGGMAGAAAVSALRRVTSLADQAPSGRMFAAIATLSDMSKRIEQGLVAGHDAMEIGDAETASLHFARTIVQMDRLAAAAGRRHEPAEELPVYLLKRR